MNPLYESHELMDLYLNGKLSAEEAVRFEQRLNSDAEFSELFEIHKITNQVIVGHELVSLKARMTKDLSATAVFPKWKLWLGVGVGALVAALAWWYWQPSSESTNILVPIDSVQHDVRIPDKLLNPIQNDSTSIAAAKPENVCIDSLIIFSCQTRGTCAGGREGAIEIDVNTIKSGISPYAFSVSKEGAFQSGSAIEGLAPGSYYVYVKDSKQCIRKLKTPVDVSAVDCK